MTVPADAKQTPIPAIVSSRVGGDPNAVEDLRHKAALDRMRGYVNGAGRIFACSATGTNIITLTPNGHDDQDGESPLFEGYKFGDAFAFWAENTSTGSVTMLVVNKDGSSQSALKAYITNGSAQAGAGNVTQNLFYVAFYVPILDESAGGFVLK